MLHSKHMIVITPSMVTDISSSVFPLFSRENTKIERYESTDRKNQRAALEQLKMHLTMEAENHQVSLTADHLYRCNMHRLANVSCFEGEQHGPKSFCDFHGNIAKPSAGWLFMQQTQ